MFSKLLLIVCAIGMIACTLLVIRQQRIETANEIASVHRRLLEQEQLLWSVHSVIAEKCQPAQVRVSLENIDSKWKPLPSAPRKMQTTHNNSVTLHSNLDG
ncbi:MAG: hypothetical protein IH984_11280 [Planctomycetes bacterium]|nr:hypothetical protein [Planctomycetota bacterium]